MTRMHCLACPVFRKSIFRDLHVDHLDRLSEGKRSHPFAAGQVVLDAGGPHRGIVCLQSGRLAVSMGRAGRGTIINVGAPGEAFGLRDWNVSATNTREVVGAEAGHYCFIPKEELDRLSAEDPRLMACVFGHLCERIASVEKSAEEKRKESKTQEL